VEQARKLVESDEVLIVFNSLGTPPNSGDPKIPELQEGTATVRRHRRNEMERSKGLPLDMGWQPNYQSETQIYAEVRPEEKPNAKIAILFSERRLW
jgi:branched-chain amino acid transport system substrate-binding protein